MRGYTTVSASMFGFSVARITGPNSLLNNWALDPDLYRGVPGLALQPDSGGKEPYRLILQPSKRNSIHYSKESATIAVQGDLDSFQREDFRRLVVHIAKTAVRRANHQLVHAAGIVGPSNEAALLCGSQGSGKTTTALYLSDRTCRICATDLCLVNADLRVVGGSTHVNLYPEMLRRYFPNLAEACISDQEAGSAFDRKISLDPTLLGAASSPSAHGSQTHIAQRSRRRSGSDSPLWHRMTGSQAIGSARPGECFFRPWRPDALAGSPRMLWSGSPRSRTIASAAKWISPVTSSGG
jgi:hypothetical protein